MKWSDILCEAYGIGLWKRWWGNAISGQILPVDHGDHDEFFFTNIDDFFTPQDLADLPDPDESPGNSDKCLIAAYAKGWCAIVFDGNNQHLGMRSEHPVALPKIRQMLRVITRDLVVNGAELDLADDFYALDAEQFARFIKFGRIA